MNMDITLEFDELGGLLWSIRGLAMVYSKQLGIINRR